MANTWSVRPKGVHGRAVRRGCHVYRVHLSTWRVCPHIVTYRRNVSDGDTDDLGRYRPDEDLETFVVAATSGDLSAHIEVSVVSKLLGGPY